MKNICSLVILAFSVLFANAQIALEHTYNGNARIANLANSGCKYYAQMNSTNQVKLYHLDHSLWKTINLSIPSGYELSYVYHIAEMLYSLDGTVACLYTYYKTTPSLQYESRIINENGNILLTIPGATSAYPYDACDEGTKLVALITDYQSGASTSKVYSLPGEFLSDVNDHLFTDQLLPYPNPSSSMVTIPYSLPPNVNSGELVLWNLKGKEVKRFVIDHTFSSLNVNTFDLPKGMYFYTVETIGTLTEPIKLVVE